jgi:hypothetical protein
VKASARPATARAPRTTVGAPAGTARSGAQHHLRVEQRDKRVEVTLAGNGQERIDHCPLTAEVGVGNGGSPHIPGMPTLPARLSTL